MEWICLAEDRVQLPVHVNVVMNYLVPQGTGNFGTSCNLFNAFQICCSKKCALFLVMRENSHD
jgi:hypothetical protein